MSRLAEKGGSVLASWNRYRDAASRMERLVPTTYEDSSEGSRVRAKNATVQAPLFFFLLLTIAVAGTMSLLFLTLPIPTWPEESGWVCIAVKIAKGEWLNPLRAKSDYPSSFQAIPIGILVYFGIFPVLASRLVSIGYLLCSGIFYALVANRFSHGNKYVIALALFLPCFAYNSGFYAIVGWHEVTHVQFLCSAVTFFFYSLLSGTNSKTHHLLGLGLSVGLSIWTLYTPCLFALAVTLAFLFTPKCQISNSHKVTFLFTVFLLTLPLAVSISYYQGQQLQRHYKFYIEGGEWDWSKYSDQNTFQRAMIANVSKAGALILPHNMGDEFHSYTGTFPEWMILTPSILGLILSVLEKNKRKAILFPLCFTSIGIILSNPTPWRMNIFGFFIILMSLVGFSAIFSLLPKKSTWLTSIILFATIVSIQILEYKAEILRAQESYILRSNKKERVYSYVNSLCDKKTQ